MDLGFYITLNLMKFHTASRHIFQVEQFKCKRRFGVEELIYLFSRTKEHKEIPRELVFNIFLPFQFQVSSEKFDNETPLCFLTAVLNFFSNRTK